MMKQSQLTFDFQPSQQPMLTKQQFADRLQVSLRTVDRWQADGTLPPDLRVVIGGTVRYCPTATQRWVDAGCPGADHDQE